MPKGEKLADYNKKRSIDMVDKFIDRFVKGFEVQAFAVTRETTYIGKKAIAERLGCSLATVDRLIRDGLLFVFVRYIRTRRALCSNETLIRLSFLAWCEGFQDAKRKTSTNTSEN